MPILFFTGVAAKASAFLEMANSQQAEAAIRTLDGSPIADRNIIVRPADGQ